MYAKQTTNETLYRSEMINNFDNNDNVLNPAYHDMTSRKTARFLARGKGDFYGHLEVAHNATQNEIKAAYYRLSKIYHPDVNKGSDAAATKFREITAAYEVLGNNKTRKLYDRGLSNTQSIYESPSYGPPAGKDDENVSSFDRTRHNRKPSKVYTGRTEAYNFDEWTRAHYSSTFARQQESRSRVDEIRTQAKFVEDSNSSGAGLYIVLMIVFLCAYEYQLAGDYDNPALVNERKAPKKD